jgi:hypothetical protein
MTSPIRYWARWPRDTAADSCLGGSWFDYHPGYSLCRYTSQSPSVASFLIPSSSSSLPPYHLNSYRVSTVKRPDFIVQGVYSEAPWFYRTECLQWSALILSYRVSTVQRPDFIVQGVYSEAPWFYRTGVYSEAPWFYHIGCLQRNALILDMF